VLLLTVRQHLLLTVDFAAINPATRPASPSSRIGALREITTQAVQVDDVLLTDPKRRAMVAT
jgi:hypothetical protein